MALPWSLRAQAHEAISHTKSKEEEEGLWGLGILVAYSSCFPKRTKMLRSTTDTECPSHGFRARPRGWICVHCILDLPCGKRGQ